MERFSPKIEIINQFDDLINKIDIDIDSSLEKFNDQQLLSEIFESSANNRKAFEKIFLKSVEIVGIFYLPKESIKSWPEKTKVADYLNQVRMKTIEELKKAQEDTLEHYKLNSSRFKSELTNKKNIE